MATLQPRSVDPGSWRRWLREALALTKRRWLTALLLALAYLLLLIPLRAQLREQYALLHGFLLLLLTLAYGASFISFAEAADRSLSFSQWLARLRASWRALFLAGSWVMLIFLLVLYSAAALLALAASVPPTASAVKAGAPPLGEPLLGWLFLLLAPCTVGAWFTLPLIVCGGCRLDNAWNLSLDAWLLNRFVWRLAVGWMIVISVLPGPFAVAVGPILGALWYVSYRHVFLGQADNAPLSLRQPARITAKEVYMGGDYSTASISVLVKSPPTNNKGSFITFASP
jgi:hypothetical protein